MCRKESLHHLVPCLYADVRHRNGCPVRQHIRIFFEAASLTALNATDTGIAPAVRATVNRDIDEGLHLLLYFSLAKDLCNGHFAKGHTLLLYQPDFPMHGISWNEELQ